MKIIFPYPQNENLKFFLSTMNPINSLLNDLIDLETTAIILFIYKKYKVSATTPNLPMKTDAPISQKGQSQKEKELKEYQYQQNLATYFDITEQVSISSNLNKDKSLPYQIVQNPNTDIFGNIITGKGSSKISQECRCPQCHRSLVATRFAPHLSQCMGMGRTSSRNSTVNINYLE